MKGAANANSLREAHYQDLSFQQQQQQSQGADSSSGFADDASSSARSDQVSESRGDLYVLLVSFFYTCYYHCHSAQFLLLLTFTMF